MFIRQPVVLFTGHVLINVLYASQSFYSPARASKIRKFKFTLIVAWLISFGGIATTIAINIYYRTRINFELIVFVFIAMRGFVLCSFLFDDDDDDDDDYDDESDSSSSSASS
jgi:hypothetical protein